jgi:tetraacyldisaccharide 4'-kinase
VSVSQFLASFPQRHWYCLSWLSCLLWPLSLLFRLVVGLRRCAYRIGLISVAHLPVPVLVVGNITVGGTGKTPLTIALAQHFLARGLRVGIVSRGHGGAARSQHAIEQVGIAVTPDTPAALVGDEARLMADRAGCPVWVGRDRAACAQSLLAAHADCQLILLDDGLQHYSLARDIELCVEDGRGHGNGLMLPAGPLREPAHRRCDATVVNLDPMIDGPLRRPAMAAAIGTVSAAGFQRRFHMQLSVAGLYTLAEAPAQDVALELDSWQGMRLKAVAGIGHPQRFFDSLQRWLQQQANSPEDALVVPGFETQCFADHHPFVEQDLQFGSADLIVMTEKDAVKCRHFNAGLRQRLCYLRVQAEPDHEFLGWLDRRLDGVRNGSAPA